MPIYQYYCISCEEQFDAFDLMSETREECLLCESVDTVSKVLANTPQVKRAQAQTGDLVKEYIKDSKEDLQNQVEELKRNR